MRTLTVAVLLIATLLIGCASVPSPKGDLATAERFIDAFYSFDRERLAAALESAESSKPKIIYYQGWAAGGNYRIVDRQPCRVGGDGVTCSITVKDDLIAALGIPIDVTDTFHLTFDGGRIVAVRTTSNDPPQFEQALQWVIRERSSLVEKPCEGFFAGGPTPGDCVRAMVRGFAEFAAADRE
jgi:hypothetical protein